MASRPSSTDVDLVRSYLRDIGRVPLLSHQQEITLGRQVQGDLLLMAQQRHTTNVSQIGTHQVDIRTGRPECHGLGGATFSVLVRSNCRLKSCGGNGN